MADWRGRCTVVAVDGANYEHGDAVAWCGHWHDDHDEANSCTWVPEDSGLRLCIVDEYEFDPSASSPCDPHGLHPGECLRCLAVRCIHLNVPEQCERCYHLAAGLDQIGETVVDQPVLGEDTAEGAA